MFQSTLNHLSIVDLSNLVKSPVFVAEDQAYSDGKHIGWVDEERFMCLNLGKTGKPQNPSENPTWPSDKSRKTHLWNDNPIYNHEYNW